MVGKRLWGARRRFTGPVIAAARPSRHLAKSSVLSLLSCAYSSP